MLKELTDEQFAGITPAIFAMFPGPHIAALTTKQISRLTKEMIAPIPAHRIKALTAEQIKAFTPAQRRDLSFSQRKALGEYLGCGAKTVHTIADDNRYN